MRVYNLSNKEVTYKGKRVPPNGGSVEITGLSFIPDRDRALETAKILAFGKLPNWWHVEQALKTTVVADVLKPEINRDGTLYSKKVTVTVDAPSMDLQDRGSVSMSSKKK